jgi:hypothetical protein
MSGTVNIARDLFDHPAFKAAPFSEREAWLWIIMEASWKPRQKRIGHIVVEVGRGQLAASVRFMAEAWGWTAAKVQRFVERLKKLEMIRVQTDTGLTLLTVCNYDKFQAPAKASDTGPIQDRYTSDTNEKKGVIREEGTQTEAKASVGNKRGSRLAADWFLPLDWGEWALTEGADRDFIRSEADKFKDYWLSKAGRDGVKLDWQATWRNWIRTAKGRNHGNGNHNVRQLPQGPKRSDPALEQIARLTGIGAASGAGRGGVGGSGQEDGPLWLGARPQ